MGSEFSLGDIQNDKTFTGAQTKDTLRTSFSQETEPRLSMTSYGLSSALQGVALYRPPGITYDVFNQELSGELENLGLEQLFKVRDDKLNPYDVFIRDPDSRTAGSIGTTAYEGSTSTTGGSSNIQFTGNASNAKGGPNPAEDNPPIIMAYMKKQGMTSIQAAGFMGNMQAESGFDSNINEIVPSWAGAGFGIVQWTAGRRTNLENFAKDRGKPPGHLGLQLEFLWHELSTSYKASVLDPVLASNDLREVARIVLQKFEIPQHRGEDVVTLRTNFAQAILDRWG